jgi:hypothetical protein
MLVHKCDYCSKRVKHPHQSAFTTGINENLIHHFCVILKTTASRYDINLEAFELYVTKTRKMYINLYPWFCMPATVPVHRILVHSPNIIKSYILPIQKMSEEAQQAHKIDERRFREEHSKRTSGIAINEDMLSPLLIFSGPVISCL